MLLFYERNETEKLRKAYISFIKIIKSWFGREKKQKNEKHVKIIKY